MAHEKPVNESDWTEGEAIIRTCPVCRMAMTDGRTPYVIPVNFGYRDRQVFIHTGLAGRKLELLAANPRVCLEWDTGHRLVTGTVPCKWSMHGRSVVATGTATVLTNPEEKRMGLRILMAQYNGPTEPLPDDLSGVNLIRVTLSTMTVRTIGE